jgi:hypothetical protein
MESNQEINAFWAALGDTISFFKGVLAFFEEYPLPLSVHDQLLRDAGALTQDANEKFDKWLSDNHEEMGVIRARVDSLVASKAGVRNEEGDANRAKKKGDPNPTKKENIVTRIVNKLTFKRSSSKRRHREKVFL